VVKTYAPEGLTPVLREKQTRDHLSVMGAMTPEGRVHIMARPESLNGMHCIEFLLHLLRVARDRLLVIWDGSPIHRRAAVREFVEETRARVWLEALPGYAPDLNPWDEGGWHHLKHVELRNVVCRDLKGGNDLRAGAAFGVNQSANGAEEHGADALGARPRHSRGKAGRGAADRHEQTARLLAARLHRGDL
jgi:hypothetical protein